jgi:hypothetical protein
VKRSTAARSGATTRVPCTPRRPLRRQWTARAPACATLSPSRRPSREQRAVGLFRLVEEDGQVFASGSGIWAARSGLRAPPVGRRKPPRRGSRAAGSPRRPTAGA